MYRVGMKQYGSEGGFQMKFLKSSGREAIFDINECPYCRTCIACGCPELTHTFCDSDIYVYGKLPGIGFQRTQTIGMGGEPINGFFCTACCLCSPLYVRSNGVVLFWGHFLTIIFYFVIQFCLVFLQLCDLLTESLPMLEKHF
ncbi:L-2-amino-thiazoline-4-carboxylic acid hydrolase [Blautia producta]|uniref:L-2-amino-thiazoline-4-carboxylic acid hydrolase n=1 Tax=Blautia producta TaxID=33035 RepID=UPI001023568C